MKIRLITLGCPKNLVDSEFLAGGLQKNGVQFIQEIDEADAIIINTCGFIESAKEESIETILQAVALKKNGNCQQVLVTGCLSERYGDELKKEIPEIDGLYGNRDLALILQKMSRQLRLRSELLGERQLLTPRHFAYLKISEGCNHPCTYCAIPGIRGAHKSRKIESLVQEAEQLMRRDVKELVLIAQDSTAYGMDLYGERRLPHLLQALNEVAGIKWIRLMYAYPYHVDDAMLESIASLDKVCHYVDMPVQHMNDRMLKRMARRVDGQFQRDLIMHMRACIPDLTLRTSLIVGFPGETEKEFQELYDFVAEGHFDRLGIFTYSHEDGTPAARFKDDVSEKIKNERQDLLYQMQADVSEENNLRLQDAQIEVLIDEFNPDENVYLGRTAADAPEIDNVVKVTGGCRPGEFVRAQVTDTRAFELYARTLNGEHQEKGLFRSKIRLPIAQKQ